MTDAERAFLLEILARPPARATDLAERVARLEDQAAVREVIAKYGYYADHLEFDLMLDLYTEDVDRELSGTRHERVVGREGLRAIFDARAPRPDASGQIAVERRHHIDTEVVKISDDGTEAWAVALGQVVAVTQDRQASHEDTYLFALRKLEGGWKIARQVVVTDNARNPILHATPGS